MKEECSQLKSRIEGLEKELQTQETELKSTKVSLKEKSNDPLVKNLSTLFQQFSLHLNDIQGVHKEMDKLFQIHKTTWDLNHLQQKLNLLESQQSHFSLQAKGAVASKPALQLHFDNNNNDKHSHISVKTAITAPDGVSIISGDSNNNLTQTLKRKRVMKSPLASPSDLSVGSVGSKSEAAKTATILVSKTKTKTGLPLILKKK